jgi:WD40 repeat protein
MPTRRASASGKSKVAHLDGCCGASALAAMVGGLAILEFQPGFLFWRPRYGSLAGHTGSVMAVVFSPDRRGVLSGSSDTTLTVWDVASGKEIRTLTVRRNPGGVNSVALSPDGRSALSGHRDRTLNLWDIATGQEIRGFAGHTKLVSSVAFSPDGRTALLGSDMTLMV